jgi:diacylglycerol kinase (ATP)
VKNRSLRARVGFAVAGWKAAWSRERSFRTQTWCGVLALVMLYLLQAPPIWWAFVAVTCALVLALELINSALEALVDLLHPEIHPEIKVIKDMLAGAVLAISCAALFAGLILVTVTVWEWLVSFES